MLVLLEKVLIKCQDFDWFWENKDGKCSSVQAYCKLKYHAKSEQSIIHDKALYRTTFKFMQQDYLEDMVCLGWHLKA